MKTTLGFILWILLTPLVTAQTDSFEHYARGTIEAELRGEVGIWQNSGHAEISDHRARTGTKALRIFGGNERQIFLTLNKTLNSGRVSFWAERWTRRTPFLFTVEARSDDSSVGDSSVDESLVNESWVEVFRDDGKQITIGGYNAHVEFEIDKPFRALRFTSTAADGGGILIDDLAVRPRQAMRIVSVVAESPVLPVLVGNDVNPIARVRIETEGGLQPISVETLRWSLAGSEEQLGVAQVTCFSSPTDTLPYRQPNSCFDPKDRFGEPVAAAAQISVAGQHTLNRGRNFLWVSVTLSSKVNIDGWISARCTEVELSDGRTLTPEVATAESTQTTIRRRFGVAVRNSGDDGVAAFRIPGIVTTQAGTLIAVYDIRHRGWGDLPGDIDVGLSRSTDGGRTWQPMQTILDMGNDPKFKFDGVGDPSILYDSQRDVIWVAATWSHGNRSWHGSGPGLDPEETGQLLLTASRDDGLTWSKPINITRQVKNPEWSFVLQSPGRGITMSDGTLVFPAQFQLSPDEGRVPHSTIIYSQDHGDHWQIGSGVKPNTTECQVVELEPGTLLLNMRDNRGGSRAIYTTRDLGQTWEVHPTSRSALPEPVCNAGLLRVRSTQNPRKPWLAFVNPAVSQGPRREMTIRLSIDGGMTWPTEFQVLIDQGRSDGYPSITLVDSNTLGIFYEGSRANMSFQRVPLADLYP